MFSTILFTRASLFQKSKFGENGSGNCEFTFRLHLSILILVIYSCSDIIYSRSLIGLEEPDHLPATCCRAGFAA
jgi:hypothetical protein